MVDAVSGADPVLRSARPGEGETIRALVRAAYANYAKQVGRTPGPVKDDYERRIAASEVWVVQYGDDVVGVIVLKEQGDDLVIVIDNVAVLPAAQGHGLGRMLITFAEQEACQRGFAEVRLYANVIMTRNIALYEHLGFVEVDRFRDGGATRIQMAKRIR